MKHIIALIVLITGVIASIYFGFWIMFVGGIVMVIEGAKMTPVDSLMIGFGVGRVVFASFATGVGCAISLLLGKIIIGKKKSKYEFSYRIN